jgi:hypothetical protein
VKKFLGFGFAILMVGLLGACAEEGKEGSSTGDCGGFGVYHLGHCHCEAGYLSDGLTCVLPEEVTAVCEDHAPEEAASDTLAGDAGLADSQGEVLEEEHDHAACRCPLDEACHCEHGTVEAFGGLDFCVPELDEY